MYIKELTNKEFDEFIKSYPVSSIYQTKEYALVMNKQNYDSLFLGMFDNDEIKAASLILIEKDNGFKYAYAPRGFLIDYSNYELLKTFTNLIKKYLGKLDIIAIKICPNIIKSISNKNNKKKEINKNFNICFNNLMKLNYYHFGYNNYFEAYKPRFEAIIDLRKTKEELFNNIKKEFKTKIRNSEKNGIEIVQGNKTNLKHLYNQAIKKYPKDLTFYENIYDYFDKNESVDMYCAKLNTKHYLNITQEQYDLLQEQKDLYNELVIRNQGKNNKLLDKKISIDNQYELQKNKLVKAINLLKDNSNGIILASALIIKHSDTVYLFMDGFDTKYKEFNAKHLLIWKLIEKYSKLGYFKFNLGGITNLEISDNKYNGLNEFKTSFNASCIEYIGDLELITNPTLYFIYRNNILKKLFKKKK